MKIAAKIRLAFSERHYSVKLSYDTFRLATWDESFIASLIVHTGENKRNADKEAMKYIDEITGKGSLNPFFKNKYEAMKKFDPDQLARIIKSNAYPQTVVENYEIIYYPSLDATYFEGRTYDGNLSDPDQAELMKKLVMTNDQNRVFRKLEFEKKNEEQVSNVYDCVIASDEMLLDLGDGKWRNLAKSSFDQAYVDRSDLDISKYRGAIGSEIEEDTSWVLLNSQALEAMNRAERYFKDANENYCVINDSFITQYKVIKAFELYFYRDRKLEFTRSNRPICELALRHLLDSGSINEFKTKNLVELLKSVKDISAQEGINYVLRRKNSKEITDVALDLLEKGLEKGWEKESLLSMKKFSEKTYDKETLYRIDPDLDFTVNDLLRIPDEVLTETDREKKNGFLKKKDILVEDIERMIGEITSSGIRERMKRCGLQKDEIVRRFTRFLNENVGHEKTDLRSLPYEDLVKKHDEISNVYSHDFQIVKSRVERAESKKDK